MNIAPNPFSQARPPRFGGGDPLAESIDSGNGMGQHYTNPDHLVVRRAVALARETGARDVLELATGHGLAAKALARETGVRRVLATDINRESLRDLKAEAAAEKLPVTARYLNAAAPQIPAAWREKFDLVIAKDLYPFLNREQIGRFLENAASALKPGGWFLLTAPSTRSQLFREATPEPGKPPLVRRLGEAAKRFIQTSLDYFSFATIGSLASELDAAGLEMTEARHYGRANGWIMAVAQKKDPHAGSLR